MKIQVRRGEKRMLLLCVVLAMTHEVGAQLPGVVPSFVLLRGSGFGLYSQPRRGGCLGFFQVGDERGFAVMGQSISIGSHSEGSLLLRHSLSVDSIGGIGLGLGVQLDSWAQGADFTMAFPVHVQVDRNLSEDSELMAFVRVTNRGRLREIQDRGEFEGGIRWVKRHAHGLFSVLWFWEYPQSWLQAQWTWRFQPERSVRFLAQPVPFCLGLDFGWVRRNGDHWIGTTYSNLLGLWMWNWRVDLGR